MGRPQISSVQNIDIQESPNEFQGYANMVRITLTNDDVSLHFALRGGPDSAKGVAKLYLGLPQAKRLALTLLRSIENYESVFGEININPLKDVPPEKLEKLGVMGKPSNE